MMGRMWEPELRRRAELTPQELAEQSDLGRRAWAASDEPDARYPRGITWSEPAWLALVRAPDGRLVGRAGVLERTVRWNGQPVKVGGVSSVSTDPAFRGQGVASATVTRVMTFACQQLGVFAGLLLAARMGIPLYTKLGWQIVPGELDCEQPRGRLTWTAEFPDKPPMAWLCQPASVEPGPIDLQGLPW
jgi:GNAT superfamily N-acetyltransferase